MSNHGESTFGKCQIMGKVLLLGGFKVRKMSNNILKNRWADCLIPKIFFRNRKVFLTFSFKSTFPERKLFLEGFHLLFAKNMTSIYALHEHTEIIQMTAYIRKIRQTNDKEFVFEFIPEVTLIFSKKYCHRTSVKEPDVHSQFPH